MRPLRALSVVMLLCGLAFSISGPDDRQITDPKSVNSIANPNAKPVAVEDLYVTRLVDAASLSPNGNEVAITTNLTGRTNLCWVTDTQWEVSAGAFSPDRVHFTYTINADGRSSLFLGNVRSGQSTELVLPPGINTTVGPQQFSSDGRHVLVEHEAMNTPNDLWMYDTNARKASQLTHMAVSSLTPQTIPPSELVHYKTFDGRIITAVLRIPFNLKRDGTNPAIIFPHGGPTGQTTDSWSRWSNALVTRGYIVLMPNPRGSTGYGMEFQRANYQDLGGGDLKDEMYGVDWLLGTGYVDPKKVGVFGGS